MTTRREIYIGVFLISLATLMFEILLTRVFSVTMWHHFAFMAVSLAMVSTTAGAGAVFLAPVSSRPTEQPSRCIVPAVRGVHRR